MGQGQPQIVTWDAFFKTFKWVYGAKVPAVT